MILENNNIQCVVQFLSVEKVQQFVVDVHYFVILEEFISWTH